MSETSNYVDLNRFEVLDLIGNGAFSKVFRIQEKSSKQIYAAKVLNYEIKDEEEDTEESLLILREINLMSSLNHRSILGFVAFSPKSFDNSPNPTIITDYAPNGSLYDLLKLELSCLSPPKWDLTHKLINIYGIASGLSYLHSHNIIHRDIKSGNILMDEQLFPKIADFGLSKITSSVSPSINKQSVNNIKGTPIYMAPEIIRDEPYTNSVDVYSFAIIVYEILTGSTPFSNLNFHQLIFKIAIQNERPELTKEIPEIYQNLIKKCWAPDPKQRPTFEAIVNDLRNNKDYITEMMDAAQFYDYIDYIDQYKATFDLIHPIHIEDMKMKEEKVKVVEKFFKTNEGTFIPLTKSDETNPRLTNLKRLEEICIRKVNVNPRDGFMVPEGEDRNMWILMNIHSFHSQLACLYSTLTDVCTKETCPTMTAGPNYLYRWADNTTYLKPTDLPACEYIDNLMNWVKKIISPFLYEDAQFQDNFMSVSKNIIRRLFRIYAHCYHHHMDQNMDF